MKKLIFAAFLLVLSMTGFGMDGLGYFRYVTWRADTNDYNLEQHRFIEKGKRIPYFYFNGNEEIVDFKLYPAEKYKHIKLLPVPSADYIIMDSLVKMDGYFYLKVNFQNITQSRFLNLTMRISAADTVLNNRIIKIAFQPVHKTFIELRPGNDELFIGEEKQFELVTNNSENLAFPAGWEENEHFEYRISQSTGKTWLHIVPKKTGNHTFNVHLNTKQPTAIIANKPVYETNETDFTFNVKKSRLQFLEVYKKDITYNQENKLIGEEVEIQNSWLLEINKTYRIENQEKPGGALIAEIYTKNALANNKVLCILRPYNLHRKSDGYLYIKDGDEARFITNFDITPKTEIQQISILREGKKWLNSSTIYPGETIDIRLEGNGLHKANIYFEDLTDLTSDTLTHNQNQLMFKLKVPLDVSKKEINIYNHGKPTGKILTVQEYLEPRPFDFILVDYGALGRRVKDIRGPLIHEQTIKDVVISFDEHIIDSPVNLYGKQYININIEITDKNNNLIEIKEIENIVVCPSSKSLRFKYYETNGCFTEDISLNDYIRKKTYDLEEWSRIEITFSHQKDKYSGRGYKKEIEIINKKNVKFDVDVSFPAGLITIRKEDKFNDAGEKTGEEVGFGSLGGISMAMIAQFSFYHPDKIAKLRPYKLGAGFLAFNAFNFSDNNDERDVGVVILGSLYPTSRDTKLSFPLYIGGGYFLKEGRWFFLIGPGIRVRL